MKKIFELCLIKPLTALFFFGVASCAQEPFKDSSGHLKTLSEQARTESFAIPEPVISDSFLPRPGRHQQEELFTVVVHEVPVNELLFALGRDANKNVDIAPGISGNVSINAIDQTLPQILERLKRQIDIRYRLLDDTLVISADTPYFVQYSVPYINLSRSSENEISIATQVASTGGGADQASGSGGGSSNSATKVKSLSVYMFWETLLDNLRSILRGHDSLPNHTIGQQTGNNQSGGEVKFDNSIIAHQETGVIAIKATEKQHKEIRKYIDNVVEHASRQVLIETTIVEVELNDDYQTGIDWKLLGSNGKFEFTQNFQDLIGAAAVSSPATLLAVKGRDVMASIKLLDTFGNTRVLSSPKLMVLNNQTAILKVVDNYVYFTTTAQQSQSVQGNTLSTIETELHTVPVGLVMSVTPQIGQNDQVIINARPTISRVADEVQDPNPLLTEVPSLIPVIQVREMESVLKVSSGDVGVIGGLMENSVNNETQGTPGLSRIPYLDNLFGFKIKKTRKTELVVFLRPRVIKTASIGGELRDFNTYLKNEPVQFNIPEFK